MVDCLENSHDMRDHERHGKLKVLDVFEYYLDEIQSLVVMEEELEMPLENGYTRFEEVHDSTTLEPTHEESFAFLRKGHNTTYMDPSHDQIFHFLIIWVSWFFLLHPTLPKFASFILMKYG